MNRRVMVASKVNVRSGSRSESKSEQGVKFVAIDPKPCDLPMARMKLQ